MDCCVHIGAEKTGTTSLQGYLVDNRDRLIERGFWYPRTFVREKQVMHRDLTIAAYCGPIVDDGSFAAEVSAARADGVRTAVISSEYFHSGFDNPVYCERLRDFLQQFFDRIGIVYYARRQDLTIASNHSGTLRGEKRLQERDPVRASSYRAPQYYNHLATADLWSGTFGRDAVICRVFEPERLVGGEIVADFSAVIGLERLPGPKPRRLNPSFSLEAMAAIIRLNGLKKESDETDEDRQLRRAVIREGKSGRGTRVRTMPQDAAKAFLARYEGSNREFFARFVDPAHATGFSDDFGMFPMDAPEWPSQEATDRFIAAVGSGGSREKSRPPLRAAGFLSGTRTIGE